MRIKLILFVFLLCAILSVAHGDSNAAPPAVSQPSTEYGDMVKKGNGLFDAGKYEEAKRVYEEAIKLDGKESEAYFEMGQTLNLMKQYAEADRYFDEAIKRAGENWLYLLGKANNADDAGKPDDALSFYGRAINAAPDKAKIRYNRAVTYLRLKRIDDSVADLKSAEQIDPKYVSPYYLLGRIYLQQNKLMLASQQLGKVLELEKTGERRKKAEEITRVDIVLDSSAPEEEGGAHMSYCLARAAALLPEQYLKRYPGAENYVDSLDEQTYILDQVATMITETTDNGKKPVLPQFKTLVESRKAGYLAPYILVTTGTRYAADSKDYEAKNPGRIAEFKQWAEKNHLTLTPAQFRCQVKWMGQVY